MGERRETIVAAAAAVMCRKGFHETSVEDVIKESGLCGKGHFYHYFKSKEELGYAVLRHQFAHFAERSLAVLRDPTKGPLERLEEFIDTVMVTSERDGDDPCGALAMEMADKHEGFRQQVDALFERWTAQIEALFWEARPQFGEYVDISRLARFTVATLEGALFTSRVRRDPGVSADVMAELKRYVASQLRERERVFAAPIIDR
ncbi:MAG TPA: TetR/AcrR family transcriptional regulator [Gemmatimonadaceae bacterium]|nr:TetR/AcrR family transcriptional regulator [Gemmatimonadaceae bacterium]